MARFNGVYNGELHNKGYSMGGPLLFWCVQTNSGSIEDGRSKLAFEQVAIFLSRVCYPLNSPFTPCSCHLIDSHMQTLITITTYQNTSLL